jgi:flagellar capping protein FliD
MAYQDMDAGGQEVYYSNTMTGTEESTLYDLGVRLPSGSTGTLTIHVDGFDDPIEMTYSEDDTLEDITNRMALYGDYNVNATIEENGSGSFVFKISSPNDIIITDTATTGYAGLKSTLLTNHGDTSLKYDYLTEIGVGSSDGFSDYTNNYRNIMRGRLSINDQLLEKALRSDSEAVWETFGISATVAGTEMKGLATQLSDKIYDYNSFNTGKIQRIIGYNGTIAQEVRRINSQIVDWSSRLNRKFEALWAKYSSLEQTISRLQEQGMALQDAFLNLNGGNN